MQTADKVFAVLSLGSAHIGGILAYKNDQNQVVPMAYKRVPSEGAVVHGAIHNIVATSEIAKTIIEEFQSELAPGGYQLESLYVMVDCRSLQATRRVVDRHYEGDGISITQDEIASILEEALTEEVPNHTLVSPPHCYFLLNGRRESSVVGVLCRELRAYVTLISIRRSYVRLLYELVEERLGLRLQEDILIAPLCEAEVVLTPSLKQMGCALVNIGKDCTTISVYKQDALELLYVYPFGGSAVTKDLEAERILYNEAEELKCTQLSAISSASDRSLILHLPTLDGSGEREVRALDLNRCVNARMKEIVMNVLSLVEASGVANSLEGGFVFSGGGSKIKDFDQLLRDCGVHESYIVDRLLSGKLAIGSELSTHFYSTPNETADLIGAVRMAQESCLALKDFDPKQGSDPYAQERGNSAEVTASEVDQETEAVGGLFTSQKTQKNPTSVETEEEFEEDFDDISDYDDEEEEKPKATGGWFVNKINNVKAMARKSSEGFSSFMQTNSDKDLEKE